MQQLIGYHFTDNNLRDGRPIPKVGKWLIHRKEVIPCESGLHISVEPFDALQYAPGVLLHLVILKGNPVLSHGDPVDKYVGSRRKILASIDATDLLREFARNQALSVVHLWDCPEVVINYLKTGDESLRAAARDAAWAAARDAARDAAWDAAWAAARAAARDAARAAARAAARDAARDAARAAAWAAARDAAWDAAWAAAWAAARADFNRLVYEAFGEDI